MKTLYFGVVWAIVLFFPIASQANPPGWKAAAPIHVGGSGDWDYVTLQPETDRLFVSHQTHLEVIDLKTQSVIASLPGNDVAQTILIPELNRGFFTNGDAGSVTFFDLKTLKIEGTIKTQPDADGLCYEPTSHRLFCFNGDSRNATIIDPAQATVLKTVHMGGSCEASQADGKGSVFLNLKDVDQVVKINASQGRIMARWSLPAGSAPSTIAIDTAGGRLFIGCRSQKLLVLDSASGRILASLPIGKWVDTTLYDPTSQSVLSSCGDGTVRVIGLEKGNTYVVRETLKTQLGARTMALDPTTHTIYLPAARLEFFSLILAFMSSHPHPDPIPDTFHLFVLKPNSDT